MSDDIIKSLLDTLTPEQKAELAKSLLDTQQQETKPVYKRNPPKEDDNNQFVMNEKVNKVTPEPVTERKRYNQFTDDGTEHKDKDNQTPSIELTERRRPAFKKVEQVCSRCSKAVEVHPQHAREFYVCDRCLRR